MDRHEVEHSTLTRPVKVLHNLQRAGEQDREVFYVVEDGNAAKFQKFEVFQNQIQQRL